MPSFVCAVGKGFNALRHWSEFYGSCRCPAQGNRHEIWYIGCVLEASSTWEIVDLPFRLAIESATNSIATAQIPSAQADSPSFKANANIGLVWMYIIQIFKDLFCREGCPLFLACVAIPSWMASLLQPSTAFSLPLQHVCNPNKADHVHDFFLQRVCTGTEAHTQQRRAGGAGVVGPAGCWLYFWRSQQSGPPQDAKSKVPIISEAVRAAKFNSNSLACGFYFWHVNHIAQFKAAF